MPEPVQLVVAVCVCIFNEAITETVSLQMGGLCEEEIEGGCGGNGIGGKRMVGDIYRVLVSVLLNHTYGLLESHHWSVDTVDTVFGLPVRHTLASFTSSILLSNTPSVSTLKNGTDSS